MEAKEMYKFVGTKWEDSRDGFAWGVLPPCTLLPLLLVLSGDSGKIWKIYYPYTGKILRRRVWKK